MTTTPPLLTDEQIDELRFKISTKAVTQRDHEVARFVESATRAPLLAEIERLTAELAKARAALEVAIHGYKCISSAGSMLFTESDDAATEMQRQGWSVIELVAAPKD